MTAVAPVKPLPVISTELPAEAGPPLGSNCEWVGQAITGSIVAAPCSGASAGICAW